MQMRFQRPGLVLLATVMLLIAVGCKQETTTGSANSGELAARVGNTDIPLSKVDRMIDQGLQGQGGKKLSDLSPVELAAARLQALDSLITEEVLYQRARQENMQISDEDLRNFIQKGIQQSGLSEDDFQKQLKAAGLTEPDFLDEIVANHRLDFRPQRRLPVAQFAEVLRLPPHHVHGSDGADIGVGRLSGQQAHLADEVAGWQFQNRFGGALDRRRA